MSIQDLIFSLQRFWAEQGCFIAQPYDLEVGAGTMTPDTFIRVLQEEELKVAYVQPSRRPADGRYGENPHRVAKHYQFQVIMKPAPEDIINIYLRSLEAIGIELTSHDLRFAEDDWEAPTLGAWGIGWQILLDGLEITQFTYFQQAGGRDLRVVPVEITYGIERLEMFLEEKDNIYELDWGGGKTYGELRLQEEKEFSKYNFEEADREMLFRLFEMFEEEAGRLLEKGLILPAYDHVLKCSHTFNLLDSRGAISVGERTKFILRIRDIACKIAEKITEGKDGRVSL